LLTPRLVSAFVAAPVGVVFPPDDFALSDDKDAPASRNVNASESEK
jgi:hypothetical protein